MNTPLGTGMVEVSPAELLRTSSENQLIAVLQNSHNKTRSSDLRLLSCGESNDAASCCVATLGVVHLTPCSCTQVTNYFIITLIYRKPLKAKKSGQFT